MAGPAPRRTACSSSSARPATPSAWLADVCARTARCSVMLARKDFQTRYKRASFGVLWAVAVPLLQGVVLAVVFSRVVRFGDGDGYGAYVLQRRRRLGLLLRHVATAATTAIVDGAGLTDKVWFPRVLLVLVPAARQPRRPRGLDPGAAWRRSPILARRWPSSWTPAARPGLRPAGGVHDRAVARGVGAARVLPRREVPRPGRAARVALRHADHLPEALLGGSHRGSTSTR